MSMRSSGGGVLQRLSSRTLRGGLHQDVQDSNTALREMALQAPPDVDTPFTQRLQVCLVYPPPLPLSNVGAKPHGNLD